MIEVAGDREVGGAAQRAGGESEIADSHRRAIEIQRAPGHRGEGRRICAGYIHRTRRNIHRTGARHRGCRRKRSAAAELQRVPRTDVKTAAVRSVHRNAQRTAGDTEQPGVDELHSGNAAEAGATRLGERSCSTDIELRDCTDALRKT